MQTLKLQVSLMRLLGRVKAAFTDAFTIDHNLRSPFTLVGANTKKAHLVGFSGYSHVLQITKPSNLPQVTKRIVKFVSINVVNMAVWHISRYMKPCQPMSKPFNVVDSNRKVSPAMDGPRCFSDKIRTVVVFAPRKNTGLHIVIQRFAQMFNGNVKFRSHDIQFTIKAAQ